MERSMDISEQPDFFQAPEVLWNTEDQNYTCGSYV